MPGVSAPRSASILRGALIVASLLAISSVAARPAAAQNADSARVNLLYWISAVHTNTYTAHILIANPTDRDVPFWSLIFDLDAEITFLNHALWQQEGTRVAVEGSGWTKKVPAQDSVWFSFAVQYDSSFHEPRNCYFSAMPCRFITNFDDEEDEDGGAGDGHGDGNDDPGGDDDHPGPVAGTDLHLDFWYSSVWENGYVAWISITNRGSVPLHGWSLSFDFPQAIGIIWNGRLSVAGQRYTVLDDGWNRAISPGDSIAFGFQGSFSGVPRTPANCVLNGAACTFHNLFEVNNSQTVTSAESFNPDGFTLEVAPNPARATTRLEFGVANPQHVFVELVDIQGRVVGRLFDGFLTAGDRRFVHADVSGMASGLYLIRMRGSAGHMSHRPVVILH